VTGSDVRRDRIAVVGGGIGGLAAAAFLRRAGLPVTVYEQATALDEVGAGLVVAPNAARLLRRLPAVRPEDVGVALETGWEFRRWADGTVLFAQQLGEACVRRYGEHTWTMHRADLLNLLASALGEDVIQLGSRCTGASQDADKVTLTFATGEPVHADVAIAADGIHSVLREHVTPASFPRPSGLCAWRSLVPADAVPDFARRLVQTLWLGHRHHLVHYPVRRGQLVNIVAFSPALPGEVEESWSAAGRPEDLAAEFAGWDPRLAALIDAATQVGRWSVLDRAPLRRWVNGRIALLGDAAHPMLPFYAQGAGQALEDAVALATLLASGSDDLPSALTRYERLRLPRASRVQEASRGRTAHHHLPDGPEQRARDAAFAAEDPLSHNDWIYSYDAEDEAAASYSAATISSSSSSDFDRSIGSP